MARRQASRPSYAQNKPLQRVVPLVRRLKVCTEEEREAGRKPHRLSPAAVREAAAIEHRARSQRRFDKIAVGFGGTKSVKKEGKWVPTQQAPGLAEETGMCRRSMIAAREELERYHVFRVVIGGWKGKGGRGLANEYWPGLLLQAKDPDGTAAPLDDAAYARQKAEWLRGMADLTEARAGLTPTGPPGGPP